MADLLQKRAKINGDILEKRYIQKVLREEGDDINTEMNKRMNGFTEQTKGERNFDVEGTALVYDHPMRLRFIDMKRRQTKHGKTKKKNYPIHNKPLFGYANNIVRRIMYGFTDQVKEEMKAMDGTEM